MALLSSSGSGIGQIQSANPENLPNAEEDIMNRSDPPIVVEETYPKPQSEVWLAITDPSIMRRWYFAVPDFQTTVGFETKFPTEHEGRVFVHQWRVLESNPNQHLAYRWTYEGFEGEATVNWDLSAVSPTATKLGVSKLTNRTVFTQTVDSDFPESVPEFQRSSCVAGWHYFLSTRLAEFLATAQSK